jgi:hypothetical protein
VCVCVHICVRVCVCLKKCLGDGVRTRIVTVYVHICVYIYIYISYIYDYISVCVHVFIIYKQEYMRVHVLHPFWSFLWCHCNVRGSAETQEMSHVLDSIKLHSFSRASIQSNIIKKMSNTNKCSGSDNLITACACSGRQIVLYHII